MSPAQDFRAIHLAMQSLVEDVAASGAILDVYTECRLLLVEFPEAGMTMDEVEEALSQVASAATVPLLLDNKGRLGKSVGSGEGRPIGRQSKGKR